MKDKRRIFTAKELAAAVVFTAMTAIAAMGINFIGASEKAANATAVVYVDGAEVKRLPLDKNTVYSPNGCDIELTVDDGFISVTKSGCKDKICMKTGKIHNSAQSIVCLPQKVAVKIINTDSNIDIEL